MATLDQIFICNPTGDDFEVRKNGEKYILKAGEETTRTQHLARHMAKHLSDRMMIKDFYDLQAAYHKKHKNLNPFELDQKLGTQKTRMTMQDTPERRIALYKILRSTKEVDNTIAAYPQFKSKEKKDGTVEFSTVGELDSYYEFVENFVEKTDKKEEPQPEVEEVTEEAPVKRGPGRPRKTAQV